MSEESYLRALARFSGDIRTGGLNFDYRTGQCGPPQATMLKSWGAACPPGFCPPDGLPQALNRYFAGDRAGCREIPYAVQLSGTGSATLDVLVTKDVTSKITMCPTRVLALAEDATNDWVINKIQFGNQNQIVGGPFPINAIGPGAFQSVPFVPDCLKAGLPFSIQATILAGSATANVLTIVFIGPAVG